MQQLSFIDHHNSASIMADNGIHDTLFTTQLMLAVQQNDFDAVRTLLFQGVRVPPSMGRDIPQNDDVLLAVQSPAMLHTLTRPSAGNVGGSHFCGTQERFALFLTGFHWHSLSIAECEKYIRAYVRGFTLSHMAIYDFIELCITSSPNNTNLLLALREVLQPEPATIQDIIEEWACDEDWVLSGLRDTYLPLLTNMVHL